MNFLLSFVFTLFCLLGFSQQNINASFVYQGSMRTYKIYIPQKYIDNPNTAVPLLLNLHGFGSNATEQELYGDFRTIADQENFIICHPNGTFDTFGNRFWNVGFTTSTIDDVGFLSALIDSVSLKYKIDSSKIFSAGMSNGGFMSYKLACELPNKVKGIASVTGSMTPALFAQCASVNAIPVMQIHGLNDFTVPYYGNLLMQPIEEVVGFWVKQNNCDSVAVQTNVIDNDAADNSTAVRYDFDQNCTDGASVALYKINNGGHTWPGSTHLVSGAVTNLDFDASAEIWKFFCPKSNYTNIKILENLQQVVVFPNPSNQSIQIELAENESLVSIQLYNDLGEFISEKTEASFDLSELRKGIYFVKIYTDSFVYIKQIIKN